MPGPNPVKLNPDNQPVSLVSIPESSYIAELAEKAYEKGKPILYQPISGPPYRMPAMFFYTSEKHKVSHTAKKIYFNF